MNLSPLLSGLAIFLIFAFNFGLCCNKNLLKQCFGGGDSGTESQEQTMSFDEEMEYNKKLAVCQRKPPNYDCLKDGPHRIGFYADRATGRCKSFQYVCYDNDLFKSKSQCEKSCFANDFKRNPNKPNSAVPPKESNHICSRGAPSEDCMMSGPQKTGYYYKSSIDQCVSFQYRCINDVFESLNNCQLQCVERSVEKRQKGLPGNSACMLPASTGPCRANYPRFHYNHKTGHCEKFTYGGCHGNPNNFVSLPFCVSSCISDA